MSAQPQPTDLLADAVAARVVERITPYLATRKRLYNMTEAAEYLRMDVKMLRNLAAAGELKSVRGKGKNARPGWRRFDVRDLDRWIEEGKKL